MINVDRLMIGNLVEWDDRYYQVNAINPMDTAIVENETVKGTISVYDAVHDCTHNIWACKIYPMELTPHVLERMGFIEMSSETEYYLYLSSDIGENVDNNMWSRIAFVDGYWFLHQEDSTNNDDEDYDIFDLHHQPKYVHELQNLVLLLTGEPLDISGLLKDSSHE
jgi:predicted MPP superfamily phosphohydrolase